MGTEVKYGVAAAVAVMALAFAARYVTSDAEAQSTCDREREKVLQTCVPVCQEAQHDDPCLQRCSWKKFNGPIPTCQ